MGFDPATGSGMGAGAKSAMALSKASSTLCRALVFIITLNDDETIGHGVTKPAQPHVLQF